MDQRTQFIADYLRDLESVTALAARFRISRKTAYKWIGRYEEAGPPGLVDLSRRPHTCPDATDPAMIDAVLEARRHHPRWGAKKLLRLLRRTAPDRAWPARSTVCDLLKRHDLIPSTRRRPHVGHPGRPLTPMTAVLRKKSRRDRLKPILVMETGENGFRHDLMAVRQSVIDRP